MVKFMYKLNIFLLYSFLGYIFEIIVDLIMKIKPSSGIMSGPFTPIYGLGVLIMLQIKDLYQRLDLNKFLEIALYFITVIIVLTILEQIGGMLLDKVFNKTLWDYSDYKFHITKYIALSTLYHPSESHLRRHRVSADDKPDQSNRHCAYCRLPP